ncbi:MAG: hypothetical protein R2688_05730 [Fimbriimonadaceae bacterium]
MKVAILSRNRNAYSTRRLKEAAIQRGHRALVLDTLKFSLLIEQEAPDLFYRGRGRPQPLRCRLPASVPPSPHLEHRSWQFQQMGVFCANTANGISNSRDKLRSMQILSRYDIGLAPTSFVRDRSDILPH